METFSSKVHLEARLPLGGNDPDRYSVSDCDELEVNGLAFIDQNNNRYQLCSVDTLYPGRLVEEFAPADAKYIFAASHTHYAPMLDDAKPKIGSFSEKALNSYSQSISQSLRLQVKPDRCRMYVAEVDVPIYRRFDYPASWVNSLLTKHAGLYPNQDLAIDKNIYIFEFSENEKSLFAIVYHACHPVSRGASDEISSDYIGALRKSIRDRFRIETVIFLLGCAGDVRPNITKKRIPWLPKSRLNWRFNSNLGQKQRDEIDAKYVQAVQDAQLHDSFSLTSHSMKVHEHQLVLKGGRNLSVPEIEVGDKLRFTFLPFEISHLFSLELRQGDKNHFLVSCSGNTLGYLPHPTQHASGGYEVDGALPYMGLEERLEISQASLF